jgi:proteasome accessory factor C
MAPKVSATDRMRRLLALVPWIAAHADGAPLEETCRRFGISKAQLLEDFEVVQFVGVYPFTPDALIDVVVDDDRIHLLYADVFRKPLGLTPEEGLALVAAGTALLATPGADPDGPLARGLAKLAGVLGVRPGEDLGVGLGGGVDDLLTTIREARSTSRRIELDYYSHGRDERTTRTVDPWRLWSQAGHWYLAGYCHLAEGERVFRLDRIAAARLLDEPFEPPATGDDADFLELDALPRAVLDLAPDARWLAESVPVIASEDRPDGVLRVTLGVTATPWLERILLQLGPAARVVTLDPRLGGADLAAAAADRVLARYDGPGRAG